MPETAGERISLFEGVWAKAGRVARVVSIRGTVVVRQRTGLRDQALWPRSLDREHDQRGVVLERPHAEPGDLLEDGVDERGGRGPAARDRDLGETAFAELFAVGPLGLDDAVGEEHDPIARREVDVPCSNVAASKMPRTGPPVARRRTLPSAPTTTGGQWPALT